MGVLNVTPDSFSDGGAYTQADGWRARIDALVSEGASIVDVGGESTRPGATAIDDATQIARVSDAVAYAVACGVLVSIDTTSPRVAEAALALGAHIVNDVSCLADVGLAEVAARAGAELVIMHSRGAMSEMAGFSTYPRSAYENVVEDVRRELGAARDRALGAGLASEALFFDPGLGFHKSADHSYALLAALPRLSSLGPLVVGASRKSFLARDVVAAPADRLGGSIAAALLAAAGGARVLRIHDVLATRQALAVVAATAATAEPTTATSPSLAATTAEELRRHV